MMLPFGATSNEVLYQFLKQLDNAVAGISIYESSAKGAAAGSREIPRLLQQIKSRVEEVQAAPRSSKNKEDALMKQFQLVTSFFDELQGSGQSKEEEEDDEKGQVQKKQEEIINKLTVILRDIEKAAKDADVPRSDSPAEGEEEEPEDSLKWSVQGKSLQLSELENAYGGLTDELKNCLRCLVTIFPEEAIIEKRLLIHLWMADGLVSSIAAGKEYFHKLHSEGFIHGGEKEHCGKLHYCKMDASFRNLLRSRIISVNENLHPMLLEEQQTSLTDAGDEVGKRKVKTVYNIDKRYLDFPVDWLIDKKYLTTLQLGRWKHGDSRHHIEVKNNVFLGRLGSCQMLRYVSLRGISRVETLPNSVAKLRDNLLVLDLRACHNLEKLPEIGNARNLQYLDISECYLLDRMPKSLAGLWKLEVLKGFIVGDPSKRDICHLVDLAKLPSLRKLSINIGRPFTYEELQSLSDFKAITTLVITWAILKRRQQQQSEEKKPSTESQAEGRSPAMEGDLDQEYLNQRYTTYGEFLTRKMVTMKKMPLTASLPASIEKLDLRCMPEAVFPAWINSNKLAKLKKLYVRGGELQTLGQGKWAAEVVRLRFLSYLTHPWEGLKASFPNIRIVEVVKCRNLTSWPQGLWRGEEKEGSLP